LDYHREITQEKLCCEKCSLLDLPSIVCELCAIDCGNHRFVFMLHVNYQHDARK
jgi:hypothetical protein